MSVKSSMLMLLGATFGGGVAICDWRETPTALAATAPGPAAEQARNAHALRAQASMTPTRDTLQKVTLNVEGMTCGGCTLATRRVLTRLDGVEKAVVTYEPPRAVVTFDPRKVTVPQMIAAIKPLSYRATVGHVVSVSEAHTIAGRIGALRGVEWRPETRVLMKA